jgi:hypothetical protein
MTLLVIVSIGATLAFAQGSQLFVQDKTMPQGALLTGNVKVTQYDGDGNIVAYRQSENHIVQTGMQILMGQLFNGQNDTYTPPSRPLSHMAIGFDGEWRLLYNDTDLRAPMSTPLPACARVAFFDIDNSTESGGGEGAATWGPDRSPGTCVAPNCAAQMNITAQATFSGAQCGGGLQTIDEAAIYTDGTLGSGQMFARNTFGSVVLNMLDTLQLDWEFTFTDTVP